MRLSNGSILFTNRQGFTSLSTWRCCRSRISSRLTSVLGVTRKPGNWCKNGLLISRILNLFGVGNISRGWVGSMRISGKVQGAVPECSEGVRCQEKHGYWQSGNKIGLLQSPRLNLFGRGLPLIWGKQWAFCFRIYYAQYLWDCFIRGFAP